MPTDFRLVADRYSVTDVLARLGVHPRGGACRCPFHGDRASVSGSVYTGKDGRERYKCHGACGVSGDALDLAKAHLGTHDTRAAVDWLTEEDSRMTSPRPRPIRKPELVFDPAPIPPDRFAEIRAGADTPPVLHKRGYRKTYQPQMVHRYGNTMLVLRITKPGGTKLPLPIRWCRSNGWVAAGWGADERRALYREAELEAHPNRPVLLVEGEKCCDLLAPLPAFADLVVITWSGGAHMVSKHDWSVLNGRDVIFWPDADKPPDGQEHGPGLAAMLWLADTCEAARRRILWPPEAWLDQDKGYDAADLLDEVQGNGFEARRVMDARLVEYTSPEPPEPPPEPPQNDPDDDPVPWIRKPQVAHGRVEMVLDPRDENNLWLWITALAAERGGYRGRFARDIFTGNVLLDGVPVETEAPLNTISHAIAHHEVLRSVTPFKLRDRIGAAADLNPVNPLADEIRALVWDRQHRHLLGYAGAPIEGEAGRWARVAGHRWLVGLVRRILTPGWQHDGVLVLESGQGTGKSSFFRAVGHILGRDLHVELDKLTRDPDVQMQLRGKCVVELAEMTGVKKGEDDALKSMLTSTKDIYRRPYGRAPEEVSRTCVFAGTMNPSQFLRDLTGHRRYWIVGTPDAPDLAGLERDLTQLLAQTAWIIEHGDDDQRQNWLTVEESAMQAQAAGTREVEWPIFDGLDAALERLGGPFLTRLQLWQALELPMQQRTNTMQMVLTKLMERRGWAKVHTRAGNGFRRPDLDDPEDAR